MSCDITLGSLQIHIDEDKWNKAVVEDHLTDIGMYLDKGGLPPIPEEIKKEENKKDKGKESDKEESKMMPTVNLGEKLL